MSDAVQTTGILVKRKPDQAGVAVTSSSMANPTVITTAAHGLTTGDKVTIASHTGSTPTINAEYTITVISPTTFSIPVNVTVAGTGGTATPAYQTIGEIKRVLPPGFSRNKIDSSIHNEGVESNVLGMLRQRDCTFDINYVGSNATHQQILADMIANRKAFWQIALPSGILYSARARVGQFNIADAPMDAIQMAACSLVWAEAIVTTQP